MSGSSRLCGNCFFEVKDPEAAHCPRCGFTLEPTGEFPAALPVGSILNGKYVIGRVLGQGGFGITYKALDHSTGDVVAIKEYFPEALCRRATEMSSVSVSVSNRTGEDDFYYGRERFLREAETLAGLGDVKGIVHVHEYFEENGTAYFSMDYVEGQDLKSYLKQRGGRMRWEELRDIVYPVMEALDSVHKRGIVHRDISPDNIYVKESGEAVLLDFGAARASLGQRSQSLSVILKHGYAPKEQYFSRGKQGPWTDVYAMGATIYRCLTGEEPPESLERSEAHGEGTPDPLKPMHAYVPVSQGIEDAVLKAMSIDAKDRFQTMGEFETALRKADENADDAPTVMPDVAPAPTVSPDPNNKGDSDVRSRTAAALNSVSETLSNASKKLDENKTSRTSADQKKPAKRSLTRRQLIGIGAGVGAAAVVAITATALSGRSSTDTHTNDGNTSNGTGSGSTSNQSSSQSSTPKKAKGLSLDKAYAVLYADGELVFQDGQDTEEGREVLHADSIDISDPWWIGKVNPMNIGGDGTEHTGDWCDQVKRITSKTEIAVPDLTRKDNNTILDVTADQDIGLFHACVNLTDISGLSSWDVSGAKDLSNMFSLCTSLTDLTPLESWDISNITSLHDMFADCRTLKDLNPIAKWDVSKVQDMSGVFKTCLALTNLNPISGWNLVSVQDTQVMFNDCVDLVDLAPISKWNLSSAKNVHGMFAVCTRLSEVGALSSWNLSSVENMNGLFYDCESLSDISGLTNWNTSHVQDMTQTFANCKVLADVSPIANWNLSSVTKVDGLFSNCDALRDLSPLASWDTSNWKSMSGIFGSDDLITDIAPIANWDISNVTDMSSILAYTGISDLGALQTWDVSHATRIGFMFSGCHKLSDISGISSWDVSAVTDLESMFYECDALKDVSPIANWNVSPAADMHLMFFNCPATPPSWYKES